jgi:hypothetical protein
VCNKRKGRVRRFRNEASMARCRYSVGSLHELERNRSQFHSTVEDTMPAAYAVSFYFKITVEKATNLIVRLRSKIKSDSVAFPVVFISPPGRPLHVACSDVPALVSCIAEVSALFFYSVDVLRRPRQ